MENLIVEDFNTGKVQVNDKAQDGDGSWILKF
jgi:hypothetical protein